MQEAFTLGQIYKFKFGQLIRSAINVRTKQERTSAKYQTGIEELGALILAEGLLQNLIGYQQKKGKKNTGIIEIVGGGRRYDALAWLVATGKIDPDTFEIEVRICTAAEAVAKSLTENSGREALPPADQFRAFQALADEGKTAEEIATAFGVDEVTIKRRLKLANVAPRLFALYEEGTATLDQLMALALTEDHATQEQVWDSLPQYNRTHHQIRNLITAQEVDTKNSKIARFVGLDEYEAAGGTVRRDLFSDNNGGFMKDAVLLESLAVEKLQRMTPELTNAGFAWVDYCTNISWDELNKFSRVKMVAAPFSDEDQAKYDAMQDRETAIDSELDDLHASLGEDEEDPANAEVQAKIDALDAENEALQEAMRALQAAYPETPDPAYVKMAGAIVTIEQEAIKIHKGLVRPEDKKQLQTAAAISRAESGEAPEEPAKAKSVHSEKLTRQLTAHRTAALQVMVAERADVGLVILAHKLALGAFGFGKHYCSTPSSAQITIQHTYLEREGEDVAASLAMSKFAEKHQAWSDLMPTDPDNLFGWLLEQEQQVILDLLAFCTAYSLNTVQMREDTKDVAAEQIAKAVKLDMADWWQPTRESYFSQVSKQHTIDVVSAQISPEVAKPMADMKKIPLTETAEQKMRDTRWLPPILKAA